MNQIKRRTFKIKLQKTIYYEAEVCVDACSEEEAKNKSNYICSWGDPVEEIICVSGEPIIDFSYNENEISSKDII